MKKISICAFLLSIVASTVTHADETKCGVISRIDGWGRIKTITFKDGSTIANVQIWENTLSSFFANEKRVCIGFSNGYLNSVALD